MATRDEVKSIMYIIANEYPDFINQNKQMQQLKVDTWFNVLSKFEYELLQQATMQLLTTHTYGTPKLSHLTTILTPKNENENLGLEFSQRIIELSRRYSSESRELVKFNENNKPYLVRVEKDSCLGQKIFDEFGETGYTIYKRFKDDLRTFKEDEANTLRAHIRDVYNSVKSRENGNTLLNGINIKLIEEEEDE